MAVAFSAVYLGVKLGPAVTIEEFWRAALAKAAFLPRHRLQLACSESHPYPQLPRRLRPAAGGGRRDSPTVGRAYLHLPHNSLPRATAFALQLFRLRGGIDVRRNAA